jgi:hypothetical protein
MPASRCEVFAPAFRKGSQLAKAIKLYSESSSVASQGLVAKCGRNEIDFAAIL